MTCWQVSIPDKKMEKVIEAKSEKQRAYAVDMINSMEARYNSRINDAKKRVAEKSYQEGNGFYSKRFFEDLAGFYEVDAAVRRQQLDRLDDAGEIIDFVKRINFDALDTEARTKCGKE